MRSLLAGRSCLVVAARPDMLFHQIKDDSVSQAQAHTNPSLNSFIQRDVTIVTTVKDRFSSSLDQLVNLREMAPGVRHLHVLSGPLDTDIRQQLEAESQADPSMELFESGQNFVNPFRLRNMVIPRLQTKYALFIYNDVFLKTPEALANLYSCAEEMEHADVFQPFIWEDPSTPHAAWNGIWFVRDGERLIGFQRFDESRSQVLNPQLLPSEEQAYFLEDHAFMVRTEILREESFMDPGGAYAQEFFDMAMELRFRGKTIVSVPCAEVMYALPFRLTPQDLLYLVWRRAENATNSSATYIKKKWGIDFWYDNYDRFFRDLQFADNGWSGDQVPDDHRTQAEMTLAMLALTGFHRFSLADNEAEPATPEGDLASVYAQLQELSPETLAKGLHWRLACHRGGLADISEVRDYAARQESVRSGVMFPIGNNPELVAGLDSRGPEKAYQRFAILEIDVQADKDAIVLEAFAELCCLVFRRGDGQYRLVLWGSLPWQHETTPENDVGKHELVGFETAILQLAPGCYTCTGLRWYASDNVAGSAEEWILDTTGELLSWQWRPLDFKRMAVQLYTGLQRPRSA
ncbi:MAG: hypothetical protein GY888_19990 [Planctomycetaceae bacterium]|nr:hypothetical protein [Planctomycetaceae bacterium]